MVVSGARVRRVDVKGVVVRGVKRVEVRGRIVRGVEVRGWCAHRTVGCVPRRWAVERGKKNEEKKAEKGREAKRRGTPRRRRRRGVRAASIGPRRA